MEGLLNLASQQRKAGIMASELTTVANQGGSGQNQTQGGIGGFDLASLVAGANAHHGNGDDISGLIQGAMGGLQNVQADPATVNEERVVANHAEAYAQGNAGSLGASAMGSAAALQAFKAFAGAGGSAGGAGGGGVQALIGMAMSEAVKLFDQSGGAANGTKQDVVNSAGETVMKLMLQNQISGAIGGGSSGGGAQELMGLASKFF